jgi:hypothetical protein
MPDQNSSWIVWSGDIGEKLEALDDWVLILERAK